VERLDLSTNDPAEQDNDALGSCAEAASRQDPGRRPTVVEVQWRSRSYDETTMAALLGLLFSDPPATRTEWLPHDDDR